MKCKFSRVEIVWIILSLPLFLFIVIASLSGAGTISYQGFAYDQEGNLYLGKTSKIDVFSPGGEMIHSIKVASTMSYDFTIKEETIIVHAGAHLFWIDLEGKELKKELNSKRRWEVVPPNRENIFISDDGTKYTMEYSGFFCSSIYRWNGSQKTELFKMPWFDYLTRLITIFTFSGLIIMVFYCLRKANKLGIVRHPFESFQDSHKLR